jgi:hypothetical protein
LFFSTNTLNFAALPNQMDTEFKLSGFMKRMGWFIPGVFKSKASNTSINSRPLPKAKNKKLRMQGSHQPAIKNECFHPGK